jgi:hypothetical protein
MSCHCLCLLHRNLATVQCRGEAEARMIIVGRVAGPREVPMCKPCARWWQDSQIDLPVREMP